MNFQVKPSDVIVAAKPEGPPVLHVIDNLGLGGAQQLLLTLASVEGPQMPFRVVSLQHRDNSVATELSGLGIATMDLGNKGLCSIPSWLRVFKALKDAPEKIVHLHLTDATIMAAPLARLLGKRVVVSLHNRAGPSPQRRRAELINRIEINRLRNSCDAIISVGRDVQETFAPLLPADRMFMVPNVVKAPPPLDDTVRSDVRRALGLSDSTAIVLTAGRLTLQKDHLTLVAAFAQAVKDNPDAILLIAGEGKMRGMIEEAIAALSLEGRVHLLGYRQDVAKLMVAADMFVLSSTSEGLPLALIEAMAHGLPVVATNVGEIPKIVTDRSGALVPPRNPPLLAQAMLRLLRDSRLRDQMSDGARTAVAPYLDVSGWKRELLTVYRQLV